MENERLFLNLKMVQLKLGYQFKDMRYLKLALIHRSFWNEHKGLVEGHNERLEFLGDAVLGLIVSEHLFLAHPGISEGTLSDLRAQLVGSGPCAFYLHKLGLENALLLGKGEEKRASGKGRETILADFFEALMGAIYLDGGLDAAKSFFLSQFTKEIEVKLNTPSRNWKAELQDIVQKRYRMAPRYEVVEESGPPHARHFKVEVFVQNELWGKGEGSSKKEAETEAAKLALHEHEE